MSSGTVMRGSIARSAAVCQDRDIMTITMLIIMTTIIISPYGVRGPRESGKKSGELRVIKKKIYYSQTLFRVFRGPPYAV